MLDYESYKKIMLALLNNSDVSWYATSHISDEFIGIDYHGDGYLDQFNENFIKAPDKFDALEDFNALTNYNSLSEEAKAFLLWIFYTSFKISINEETFDEYEPIIRAKLKKILPNSDHLFEITAAVK